MTGIFAPSQDQRFPPGNPYPLGTGIPTQFLPNWNTYTGLSDAQKAAYEAFPQDLSNYTSAVRWYYENRSFPPTMNPVPNRYITVGGIQVSMTDSNLIKINGIGLDAMLNSSNTYVFTVNGTVYNFNATQAIALFNGVRGYIQQCRDIEGTTLNAINASPATITNRTQIDAAFSVLN